jgi:hypothetical protein
LNQGGESTTALESIWSIDEAGLHWVLGAAPAQELFEKLRRPKAVLATSAGASLLRSIDGASMVLLLRPGPLGLLGVAPETDQMVISVGEVRQHKGLLTIEVPSTVLTSVLQSEMSQ